MLCFLYRNNKLETNEEKNSQKKRELCKIRRIILLCTIMCRMEENDAI